MSLSFNFRLKEGQPAPFRIFVAKVLVVIATRVAATDPDKGVTKYDRSHFAVAFDELGPLVQDMVTPWSRTPWGTCAKMARSTQEPCGEFRPVYCAAAQDREDAWKRRDKHLG